MSKKKEKKNDDAEANPTETPEAGAEGEIIEGESGGKKGKRKLIIIVAAVLLLVGGGAGAYFSGLLGGKKEEATTEGEAGGHGEHGEGKEGEAAKSTAPVYFELPQFLVNLNSTSGHASFLKMSVTLELRDAAAVATMTAAKPRIVDTFNTYLRELRPNDIQGSAGLYHLRTELIARLNSTIEDGIVKDILFGEIIVQ